MRTLALSAALLSLAAPALAGTPVDLRAAPVSHGEVVTLADLFDGAVGPASKVVVAPAATQGMNAVLDAGRVQLAAKAAGFDWDNAQGQRRIVVGSAGGAATPARATSARAQRSAQALAYARNISAGEIIQAADLVWSDDLIAPNDAPGDPDRVVGQSARRALRSGAAVQKADLAAATVIRRDETVAVAFEAGGISLVLQGKALKDAAVGDSVQILNPQSKKIIEAVAAGPGRALVGPRAERLKAAAFSTASLR